MPIHVVQRGVNRQICFRDDQDRRAYLADLARLGRETECAIHAYVLMTNHVHLLLTPRTTLGPARLMNRLGRRYVRRFNDRHERTGTLWEGRFRSCITEDEVHLLACYRYIELNPVRAGIVAHPAAYPWSSHRANAVGDPVGLLTAHPCFLALGRDRAERRAAYAALFAEQLSDHTIATLRAATQTNAVFGSEPFMADVESRLGRRAVPRPTGRPRKP